MGYLFILLFAHYLEVKNYFIFGILLKNDYLLEKLKPETREKRGGYKILDFRMKNDDLGLA